MEQKIIKIMFNVICKLPNARIRKVPWFRGQGAYGQNETPARTGSGQIGTQCRQTRINKNTKIERKQNLVLLHKNEKTSKSMNLNSNF